MLKNKISTGKFIKVAFFNFAFLVAFVLFGASSVSAAVIVDVYTSSPPPPGRITCSFTCAAPSSELCWNSQAVGVTDCGSACSGGSPWTKYQYSGCYQDPERPDRCERTWVYQEAVCSTADKCTSEVNNPYLNAGRCDCTVLGIYKTCCSNSGGISANSCVPITPFSGAPFPPMDGLCPAGSYWIMCGVSESECVRQRANGNPCTTTACGPGVCGPVNTPPPPPPPPSGDSQAPTCNGLTLSTSHAPDGTRVTITGSTYS